MKKIGILICCIISILLLIILIDIIRVAGCSEPYLTISSNCEYTEEGAVYTNKGIGYKYVENGLDTILGIETYIFGIKSCDIPSGKDPTCIKEQKIAEPEFTGYYFIAETPASNPVSTSFSISDPGNTPLRTGMVLNMPITGFNNGDIVKVYYGRDYEELEKFTDFHTPRRASKPYKTEIIGSLKDELFIPRDNSQYKLQTENIEEPIIKTRKGICRLYDESFNETIYEYTYPDLGIRITTPECWDTVHEYDKSNGVLFRSGSTILSTNKGSADWFYEYLTPYTKDPNQSLEEIIKERHLNPGCELNPGTPIAFNNIEGTGYFVTAPNGWSSEEPTRCYSDDEDDNIKRGVLNVGYFEPANDKSRYYKLRLLDGCAPGPCTIFGKVETL